MFHTPAHKQQSCMCKDRLASQCPGEWEPGCDLGNNEKHVKIADYIGVIKSADAKDNAPSRGRSSTLQNLINAYKRLQAADSSYEYALSVEQIEKAVGNYLDEHVFNKKPDNTHYGY